MNREGVSANRKCHRLKEKSVPCPHTLVEATVALGDLVHLNRIVLMFMVTITEKTLSLSNFNRWH